jgi:hypothetical protein
MLLCDPAATKTSLRHKYATGSLTVESVPWKLRALEFMCFRMRQFPFPIQASRLLDLWLFMRRSLSTAITSCRCGVELLFFFFPGVERRSAEAEMVNRVICIYKKSFDPNEYTKDPGRN